MVESIIQIVQRHYPAYGKLLDHVISGLSGPDVPRALMVFQPSEEQRIREVIGAYVEMLARRGALRPEFMVNVFVMVLGLGVWLGQMGLVSSKIPRKLEP